MAAGSTYTPIATTTLGSTTNTVTFSSISGSYTDLVLVASFLPSGSGPRQLTFRFNGDTGSNYSDTFIYGRSSAGSGRDSNATGYRVGYYSNTSSPVPLIMHFQSYSNTNVYKTVLTRFNSTTDGVEAYVGLWRNTAAITSFELVDGVNFLAGSQFTLYGIQAA